MVNTAIFGITQGGGLEIIRWEEGERRDGEKWERKEKN